MAQRKPRTQKIAAALEKAWTSKDQAAYDDAAKPARFPKREKPAHGCPICWPRYEGVGQVNQASVSMVSMYCTDCHSTWSIKTEALNELLKAWRSQPKGADDGTS